MLFNETEDIQTNEDSQDLTHTSKEERLFAEEKLGKIDFKGTLPEENKRDSIYNQSFSYVKRLGTNMEIYVTLIERKIVSIIGLLWKVSQCSVMI